MRSSDRATSAHCAGAATTPSGSVPKSRTKYKSVVAVFIKLPNKFGDLNKVVLGLGLSIASQVIARHGGTIEAAPAEARGTIVTVRLPLARVQREERVAATRTQPVSI